MIGDLFDSPWKILIVAVVIIVLFGSKKLPGAARSLGQSMRILKREVSDLHHEDEPDSAPKDGTAKFPPAQLTQVIHERHAAFGVLGVLLPLGVHEAFSDDAGTGDGIGKHGHDRSPAVR